MSDITIFFKNGKVIGSCPVGQEDSYLNPFPNSMPEIWLEYDRTLRSTDERWDAWARARCYQSEAEAQELL